METTILYRDYIEAILGFLYWGYIGIMEKKMETTLVCWGHILEHPVSTPEATRNPVTLNCQS